MYVRGTPSVGQVELLAVCLASTSNRDLETRTEPFSEHTARVLTGSSFVQSASSVIVSL